MTLISVDNRLKVHLVLEAIMACNCSLDGLELYDIIGFINDINYAYIFSLFDCNFPYTPIYDSRPFW